MPGWLNLDSQEARGYIALAMGVLGLSYLFLRRAAKKRRDPLEPSAFGSLSQQRSVERQMQSVLVEMAEMARQISGQLDSRAAKLDELIRQADDRLAKLRGANPDAAGIEPAIAAPTERHIDIYTFADQGLHAGEIASRLGRPRGEVELILALRGNVSGNTAGAVRQSA